MEEFQFEYIISLARELQQGWSEDFHAGARDLEFFTMDSIHSRKKIPSYSCTWAVSARGNSTDFQVSLSDSYNASMNALIHKSASAERRRFDAIELFTGLYMEESA